MYFLTGDEIVSNTNPSLIKLDTSLLWFYLQMKGGPAEVTLSTVYGYNDNAYKFVFGDGDGTRFSIRDQGEYLRMKGGPAEVTLSSVYGYNDNAYKFVFGDGDGT